MSIIVYAYLTFLLVWVCRNYWKSFDKGYLTAFLIITFLIPQSAFFILPQLKIPTIMVIVCWCAFFAYKQSLTSSIAYDRNILRTFLFFFVYSAFGMLLGQLPLSYQLNSFARYFFLYFTFPLFAWYTLDDEDALFRFNDLFCKIAVVTCLYGVVEYIIEANPLMEVLGNTLDMESMLDKWETNSARGMIKGRICGLKASGLAVGQIMIMVFGYLVYMKDYVANKRLLNLTLFLALTNVVLAGSRSSVVPAALLVVGLVWQRARSMSAIWLLVLPLLLLVLPYVSVSDELSDTFKAFFMFFDSSNDAIMGGSSMDLRIEQLTISLRAVAGCPWFGNGFRFMETNEYATLTSWMIGAESIVFYHIMEHGLVGLVMFFAFLAALMVVHECKYKAVYGEWNIYILFFHVAYWASIVMTGDRMTMVIYLTLTILSMKSLYIIKSCNNVDTLSEEI